MTEKTAAGRGVGKREARSGKTKTGAEAPSEMLIYLPDFKALCTAEDATHNLHNLVTLRGAVVRDPHGWSNYLTETIDLFGGEFEVVLRYHHGPPWDQDLRNDSYGV